MNRIQIPFPVLLIMVGTFLILLNSLIIAYMGSPIILQSSPASTIQQLQNAPLWFRIVFGIPSYVKGMSIIFWIVIAGISFALSFYIYRKPMKTLLPGIIIIIFSFASLLAGGGFVIGFILSIIGTEIVLQRKTPVSETFFVKLLRACRLDSDFFKQLGQSKENLKETITALILITFASGFGGNLYAINADKVLHADVDTATKILLQGDIYLSLSAFYVPIINIGLAIVKWFLLSSIIYVVGSKLLRGSAEFDSIAKVVAFAYAPVILQFFIPFVMFNQPQISAWPIIVAILTNLWMGIALIAGVKVLYEIETRKALGLALISGSSYWILTYKFLLPIIFESSGIPGIIIEINPTEFIFLLLSVLTILAILLGTFSER